MEDSLQYPIGKFDAQQALAAPQIDQWIADIAALPDALAAAVNGLTSEQLDTPYRPGGWTVRQVIHHLPDSHIMAYTRFRRALTEEQPTISLYFENRWAELPDYRDTPVETSLALLSSLHRRWVVLLKSMQPADFQRTYIHPQRGAESLVRALATYAWHGRHHLAHITSLLQRMNG